MKKLLFAILLITQCASISQNLNQTKDSLISTDSLSTLISMDYYPIRNIQDPETREIMYYDDYDHVTDPSDGNITYWILKDTIKKYKPLVIEPDQVFNVYVGLKQNEILRSRLNKAVEVSKSLNDIVQKQNNDLQKSISNVLDLNSKLEDNTKKRIEAEGKLKDAENKITPWYKNPFLYLGIGFIGGIYVTK